jgi:Peptidase family M28
MGQSFLRFKRQFSTSFLLLVCCCAGVTAQTVNFSAASREVIEARLQRYGGDDQQREATLKQLFTEVGCDSGHLSEQAVKGSKVPNLICLLPGSSEKTILVGAHFDHFPKGDGVVDNWTGAVLLSSLYQGLKGASHQHTYIFIGFTDGEKGWHDGGVWYFADHMKKEELRGTDAMVNIDSLGLGHPTVWACHNTTLTGMLLSLAKGLNVEVTCSPQNVPLDSLPFSERNVPSISISSLTQETYDAHIAQSEKDKISAVQFDDYYLTYRLIAAYLASLDRLPPVQRN